MYMGHHAYVEVRGQLTVTGPSFRYVGPRDWAQLVSLGSKHLYLLSYFSYASARPLSALMVCV